MRLSPPGLQTCSEKDMPSEKYPIEKTVRSAGNAAAEKSVEKTLVQAGNE